MAVQGDAKKSEEDTQNDSVIWSEGFAPGFGG